MSHKNNRLQEIINLVNQKGYLTTSTIAEHFNVSTMTIRRDLNELSKTNKIKKTYGGAKPFHDISEFTTDEKLKKNIDEKREIAKNLSNLIPNNASIFLGAGTTLLMATSLLKEKHLTIITNSFPAFVELSKSDSRLFLTGGELHKKTGEFLGEFAELIFSGLNIDFAIGSTNGIADNNVTTNISSEGSIQNAAFKRASKTIITADHTKLGISDVITFRNLSEFDYLVTDSGISNENLNIYSKYTKIIY